jgi:hypothetical protein
LLDFLAEHEFGGEKTRPYAGQDHTFSGKRGRRCLPAHLTLRDLADIIFKEYASLLRVGPIDPTALAQCICFAVEQAATS